MKRERAENLFNLLGEIDDEMVVEAEMAERKKPLKIQRNQRRYVMRFVMAAASFTFLVIGALSVMRFFSWQAGNDDAFLGDLGMAEADDSDWVMEEREIESGRDDSLLNFATDESRADFVQLLTEEQLRVVFPGLDIDELELEATALYLEDGTLIEVIADARVFADGSSGYSLMRIRLSENSLMFTMDEDSNGRFTHYFHDVEVTIGIYHATSFMLGHVHYYITGATEEILSQIILNGPADLSILADPEM